MSHTSFQDLQQKVEDAKTKVKVGSRYYHYKNPNAFYKLLNIVIIEATEEVGVAYQNPEHPEMIWIRTLPDFLATVEVDGKTVNRFTLLDK